MSNSIFNSLVDTVIYEILILNFNNSNFSFRFRF